MRTPYRLVLYALLGLLLIGAGGCTSGSNSTPTAGKLADAGTTVYNEHCASCHGANGEGITGPEVIGPANTLDKYQTAKGLYDFISTAMPNNAPGSLTPEQYLSVESFLLMKNSIVQKDTPFTQDTLVDIQIK
jgi:mono/diheme cytochrome c family protein